MKRKIQAAVYLFFSLLLIIYMCLSAGSIKYKDITAVETSENGLSFSLSADEFVDNYNNYYKRNKGKKYLPPIAEWQKETLDNTVHYSYTANSEMLAMPGINIYTACDSAYIKEIALDFDDHSYTENNYKLYSEICFYTLKVLLPDLENARITELYKTLNAFARANIKPCGQGYKSGVAPCALYYKESVGVYPCFAVGESLRLCIIPITGAVLSDFENKSVEIKKTN